MLEHEIWEAAVMEWKVNRFLKDKWINFYSNPKNSMKDYILVSVVSSIILILITWGYFPIPNFYYNQ